MKSKQIGMSKVIKVRLASLSSSELIFLKMFCHKKHRINKYREV